MAGDDLDVLQDLTPDDLRALRRQAIEAITPEIWAEARRGFGDPDLADG